MDSDKYAHISEITTSLRKDMADARERLASIEAHVFTAHVKEMEHISNRMDRLSTELRMIRHIQWLMVLAVLTNLAVVMFKN